MKKKVGQEKEGIIPISDPKELIDELTIEKEGLRGALYSLFHHTNIDAFSKMAIGGNVWMSRIDKMNDLTEVFKNADRTYAFCLTAKPTENVGMWIAYGLPRREAIRIRFSGKALMDVITASNGRVSVYPVKGDTPQSKPVSGTASLQYVGYVSRGGKRVHVGKEIYELNWTIGEKPLRRKYVMDRCGSFIKRLGWQYENELRFVVTLDRAIDAERVQIDLRNAIEGLLTYKPKTNKNGSIGMPSVIVGPWSGREAFVKAFREKLKGLSCEWQDKLEYFLSQATEDDKGLIRESEYKGKINLGRCKRCDDDTRCRCECVYYEGETK